MTTTTTTTTPTRSTRRRRRRLRLPLPPRPLTIISTLASHLSSFLLTLALLLGGAAAGSNGKQHNNQPHASPPSPPSPPSPRPSAPASATKQAQPTPAAAAPHKIAIIGSGNFGSAVARVLGRNVLTMPKDFEPEIRMWVFEEMCGDRKLSEIINTDHENVKYLPGVKLPPNVKAVPDLEDAARGASIVIFVLPHQFLPKLLPQLRACLDKNGRTVAVSLIKGLDFNEEGPVLISDIIRKGLGDAASDVCVLMGANVADEMAQDEFCEATVGCHDQVAGDLVQRLFDCPSFRVDVTRDPLGVELCGALKNVVALGAGFCDGLSFGGNTKAAVIRHGLQEMREFCKLLDPENVQDNTFFESCGVADLITTCYGGRNRKCAEKFAQAEGKLSWDELEYQELGGQKLQGTHTAAKLYKVLKRRQLLAKFPLFHAVYEIAFKGKHPSTIVAGL